MALVTKVAQEIKASLENAFPGTHFMVGLDDYLKVSGHDTILIAWQGNPSEDLVHDVVRTFVGKYSTAKPISVKYGRLKWNMNL